MYDYKCKCGHEFTDVLKVSDRNVPVDSKCPECSEKGGIQMVISSPRIVSGVGELRAKVSDNFKDRLREIKKTAGKNCTIDV
jgi:putative FmdB family regulatory protein